MHDRIDGGHAVAGGENAVVGGGGAAALDMPEGGGPGLDAGAGLDLGSQHIPDAAEARATECVEAALGVGVVHRVELEALGDHDERGAAARVRRLHPLDELVHARLLLGDEDRVRARRHARVQRDPADVASHHFGDHAPSVGVAGRAQPIHRLGGDLHSGIESEGVVGGREVVVDCLGHADDLDAGIGEALRGRESTFTADRDE